MSQSHQSSQSCLPTGLVLISFHAPSSTDGWEVQGSYMREQEGSHSRAMNPIFNEDTHVVGVYFHGSPGPASWRRLNRGCWMLGQFCTARARCAQSRWSLYFCLLKAEAPSHRRSWVGISQHLFASSQISQSLSALLCRQDLLLFQVHASLFPRAPGNVSMSPSSPYGGWTGSLWPGLDAEGKPVSSEGLFNPDSAYLKDASARGQQVLLSWRRISFHKTLDLGKVL